MKKVRKDNQVSIEDVSDQNTLSTTATRLHALKVENRGKIACITNRVIKLKVKHENNWVI